MDIEFDNRDSPSYLAHYGMQRPPFATKTEDDMYYPEPTRTQRLDLLLHLTQYGNEMLLVTGPKGSGKTTLAQHFLKKAPRNWKICSLNVHSKFDEEQMLYRICHCLNLAVEPGASMVAAANIKRELEQLLADTATIAVVIDDAHILSDNALVLLTELAKIKNKQSGALLRIVLFAEPQIKIQFASIELENKPKYPVRKIDLPAFDEKNTGELIRHRARIAGLVADNTFTDSTIAKIYKQSHGIPGEIIELAHRVLFEMTPLKRRTKIKRFTETDAGKPKLPLGLVLAVVVLVLIALILLFKAEINELYKKQTQSEVAEQRAITSLALPKLAQTEMEAEANEIHEPLIASETVEADPESRVPDNPDETGSAAATATLDTSTPQHSSSSFKHPELARSVRRENWLLEQNPQHYTLQLVAGYQQSTVDNYLNRHPLSATELAYYHSYNRGKDWYSLVYGVFPDYTRAKLAVENLPSEIRQANPWIRRLENIHAEIKDAANSQ